MPSSPYTDPNPAEKKPKSPEKDPESLVSNTNKGIKRQSMTPKMQEQAKVISRLIAEQEKEAKENTVTSDGETCDQQLRQVLGKITNFNEDENTNTVNKKVTTDEKKSQSQNSDKQ